MRVSCPMGLCHPWIWGELVPGERAAQKEQIRSGGDVPLLFHLRMSGAVSHEGVSPSSVCSISSWGIEQGLGKQLSFRVCHEFFQRDIHYKAIKSFLYLPCKDFSLLMTFRAVLQLTPPPLVGDVSLIHNQGSGARRDCAIYSKPVMEPRCPDIPPHL